MWVCRLPVHIGPLGSCRLVADSQKNRSGFSGRFKGAPGGNRNPPGIVFFLQLFLSEKQKKKLDGSRKFLICVLSCCMYGWLFV